MAMKTPAQFAALLLLPLAMVEPSSLLAQGTLTPPGAPAPTMKSLDQIEPRTPVDAMHTPGDSGNVFIITQPGSYYLTTNLIGVSGRHGINIAANNVTLDLNGLSLLGVAGALDGIFALGPVTNITVRNGIITGWTDTFGIRCGANYMTVERLTVTGNEYGVDCIGNNAVIRDCIVSGNSRSGILAVVGSGSLVIGNNCAGNNTTHDVSESGIHISGFNHRIEGNHVTGSGSGYGIRVVGGTGNIIVKNSVEGVGTNNYSFPAGQIVGPIITNVVSGIITNSNPWANFSF
jgi:hypothetical protein